MNQEYSKEFFWDTYKKLPEDLKEALFSDRNNEIINHICIQSGLTEEQSPLVAKFTGRVLMGLLPLNELPVVIELELNIPQDLANQINRQIYISIFKPVRISLNKINDKNFNYRDLFTSESDGREEAQRRREEENIARKNPKVETAQSFRSPKLQEQVIKPKIETEIKAELSSDTITGIEEDILKNTNTTLEKTFQSQNPPFSYSEPAPEKKQIENKELIPAEIKQETSPVAERETVPVSVSVPKPIPSKSAFEQELQKEANPFPEIPTSFSIGIPTVMVGNENTTSAPAPISNSPIPTSGQAAPVNPSEQKNITSEKTPQGDSFFMPTQIPVANPDTSAPVAKPAPIMQPKIIVPDVIVPEEEKKEPTVEAVNSSDPYKELPM